MNNTEKTIRNSIISVIAQIIIFLLSFVNRRVFVCFLDIEYLGYQSLFGNIFTILSVAELGIGQVITYQLYKEIVTNNKQEIGKLMYLYKWLYRLVALIVTVIGLLCFLFLPFFVKGVSADWSYIRLIYLLQLSSVVAGYFLSYKSTILIASQQEYRCTSITLWVSIIMQVLQLALLAIFKNYIIYLCVNLLSAFIGNLIIAIIVDKEYPYIKDKYKITREDIKNRNILNDTKNFLIHKIAYAIYNGTDNIVISAFCGIRNVALYGSYVTVKSGVMNIFFYKLLNPIQATLGNIVNDNRKKDDLWEQFKMFDVFSFFFASYIGLGFFIFLQPFIALWLGTDYLLSIPFVALYSITIYIGSVFEIVYKYRSVFGEFKKDRNLMVLSAILNILISVVCAKKMGIVGVQLGTIIALLPMEYGRIRFVVRDFFGKSIHKYLLKHLILFLIVCIEGALCYLITAGFEYDILHFIIRGFIWLFVPGCTAVLIFFRNKAFKEMLKYLKSIVNILFSKVRRRKHA